MSPDARRSREAIHVLNSLLRTHEEDIPIERKYELLRSIRRESPEIDGQLDRALLQELEGLRVRFQQAHKKQEQLKVAFEELKEECRRLTAPPLRPATFLELRTIGGLATALVSHDHSLRYVQIADEVKTNALKTGDQVLISGDANILVEKVSCAQLDCGETAIFERYAPDGRLVLAHRDEEIIVNSSEKLQSTPLKRGDRIRWSQAAWLAYERIERSSGDHLFLEAVPQETFADVGGLDQQIEALKQVVLLHFQNPEMVKTYHLPPLRSVLLIGPPGTGKTMLVKAMVNWFSSLSGTGDARFINIKPGGLGSMWYSESERRIREIFLIARESAASNPGLPVVLFFDEVDSIGASRGGRISHVDDRVLNAFAVELQGLEDRGNILVVAATNRLDILDPALIRPGRLGDRIIEVPRPNKAAARSILSKYFDEGTPYARGRRTTACAREELIESALSRLYSPNGESDVASIIFRDGSRRMVKAGDMVSGASLAKLAHECKRIACLREIETGEAGIRLQDVLSVIAEEVEKAANVLTPSNCRRYLSDLPQDMDVVSIEPVRRKPARVYHYLQVA